MGDVGLANLDEARVRIEVVVAVRQAQAADAQPDLVAVRVLAVGAQIQAERCVAAVDAGVGAALTLRR